MTETQNKAEIDSIRIVLNNHSEAFRTVTKLFKALTDVTDTIRKNIGILNERIEKLEKSNEGI